MAEGKSSNPLDLSSYTASAGKVWDDKLKEAGHAFEEQVKGVTAAAEAALDAGISKLSAVVRSGVATASQETSEVKSRARQFYETGVAHYQAAEQQAVEALKKGVRCVTVEHPDASLAAGVGLAAVLLPGPRRFLLRKTIGRFRSEEAMYKSAELRYTTLRDKVEGHQGDLKKLQERLQLAQQEYERGLAKLKSTAGELESLASRVQSSEKAAKALVADLRQLPSKQALQLRSDAANTAATAGNQRNAMDKMLQRLVKQYGI